MTGFRGGICVIALLMLLQACGGGKAPPSNNNNGPGQNGSSVYDPPGDGNAASRDVGEEVLEDPLTYTGDSGNIDSSEMTLPESPVSLDRINWEPVYFDFDKANLTDQARSQLAEYSQVLKSRRNVSVLMEGHCDSRGTENYNLALGERRVQTVKRYMQQLGVSEVQMKTISYGELRPDVRGETEAAWARNRRVSFILKREN